MDFTGRVVSLKGSCIFVLVMCVCELNNGLATSCSVAGYLQSITEAYSVLISNIFFVCSVTRCCLYIFINS